jgi:NADH:ubiquinone reductase (H+-translocating)
MIERQPPRIVVVGAGYAGLSTALRLARQAGGRARVEVVDGRAEHQLITRLHEVAAGRLAPAAAAVPLGMLLAGTDIRLHRAWVEGIDLERGQVTTSAGLLQYDTLVLAPGSRTDYRGVRGAAEYSLPLRTLEDALRLREKVGTHLRQAARTGDAERDSGFTFLVVGGGYTGIELAAELAYRSGRRTDGTRIGLLEAGPRLLPGGDGWLAREAAAGLERLGVQLFLGTPAVSVDARGVQVQGGEIGARHVVWATGVRAPRLLAESGLHVNGDGRALVDRSLAATGHSEVLVLGDAAAALDSADLPLPSSAQVAVQQAKWAADNLAAALRGRAAEPFVPWLEGEALSLGPHDGLARVGRLALADAPAVLVKRLARARYLSQLGGPALPVFQCARQHQWDWMPQPPAAHTSAAEGSRRGVVSERAA